MKKEKETPTKRGKGRPLLEVDEALCKKVESLAAQGLTMNQISLSLGICIAGLYGKVRKHEILQEALERGRAKGIAQVTNALFKNAIGGDTNAQKYYLNNRDNANWKDRQTTELTGSVTITHEQWLDKLND